MGTECDVLTVCKLAVPACIEVMGLGDLSTVMVMCRADTASAAWVVKIFVAILTLYPLVCYD